MVFEMGKKTDRKKNRSPQDLRQVLAENNACFVLVTCSQPSKEGKMQVEMIYEGDPSLAAYLAESAYTLIENQNEMLINND